MEEAARKRQIGSISVGFRLIEVLAQSIKPLSLTEISKAAGFKTGQSQLYMNSFLAEGLVEQDRKTLKYRLGGLALQLGMLRINAIEPTDLAFKHLSDLTVRTGRTGLICIWTSAGPIIIRKIDRNPYAPVSLRIGHVQSLLRTATGIVFCAHLHPDITETLLKAEFSRSANAAEEKANLAKAIDHIRATGWAYSANRTTSGFAATSAPVFDHSGATVCTMTLLGPESELTPEGQEALAADLLETTRIVSSKLGWV